MRDIYVERRENLLRVAIKKNNLLSECYIEEESLEPVQGEIYKGIVKRVVPGIKSAFIDIGYSKQAYMILGEDEKDLKQGDGIIVEVLKEQFGSKGAKVTSKISLAGRYCVLETSRNDISISRKIENLEFKKELENSLVKPSELGVTVRTKAQSASIFEIQEEIEELYKNYKEVTREGKFSLNPKKIMGKGDLINKIIRDDIDAYTSSIIVDSIEDYERIKDSISNSPSSWPSIWKSCTSTTCTSPTSTGPGTRPTRSWRPSSPWPTPCGTCGSGTSPPGSLTPAWASPSSGTTPPAPGSPSPPPATCWV